MNIPNCSFIELLADAEQIISAEYKEKQRAKRRQEAGEAMGMCVCVSQYEIYWLLKI